MISQFTPPTVHGFSRFVRRWFLLLSQWRFDEAAALLDPDPVDGRSWTIEDIQQALRDVTEGGVLPEIADPSTLPEPDNAMIRRRDDKRGYLFEYPLPQSDGWSPVRVGIEFFRRPGGYAVVLRGFGPTETAD